MLPKHAVATLIAVLEASETGESNSAGGIIVARYRKGYVSLRRCGGVVRTFNSKSGTTSGLGSCRSLSVSLVQ